jgi:hypothetical protein
MNSNNNYNTSDEVRKDYIWMLIGVFVLGVFLGVALACVAYIGSASAETVPEERWAICQPDSYLNIREKPKKTANIGGWLYLGDRVETDGKMQNGYLHIVNASTESGDGWVAARYLMEDQPTVETVSGVIDSKGRVAARIQPDGKRNRWMKPGDVITIYAHGSEWAVTNRGFIKSEYIAIGE